MSQIKIVKGNDAQIQWRVSYQGQPLDLTGKAVTLYVINSRGPFQLKDFEVEGHVVTATYYGADQTRFGEHSLVLRINEGRPEMSTVAVKEAFELVEWSKDQGGESGEPIKVTPIILEADVAVAQGGSSYDDTELRNEIEKKQDKAVVFTPELLGDPIAVYESEGTQRLGYSQSQIEVVLGKPIEEVYQEWKDREVVLSALSYSYYALNKGVSEGVKMLVMNYTDPSEESDMEYVLSLYVNGATLNGQRVYLVLESRPATSGVSKDYVDGKLTELSAEVSGLSERIENLPSAESSVFEAVYGETTYDEIVEAVKAKKHIICFHKNRVYNLCNFQQGRDLLFTCAAAAIYTITLKITSGNWVESQYDYEIAINKVTTINENSTDTKYPSAKAVYDFVQSQGGGSTTDLTAVAKWGVVTQTLKQVGNTNDGYRVEVSAPQYGWIPQAFIDEVTNFGGVATNANPGNIIGKPIFNAETGYFEYQGIVNLAYDEMRAAYAVGRNMFSNAISNFLYAVLYRGNLVSGVADKLRCILHYPTFPEMGHYMFHNFCAFLKFLEIGIVNQEFGKVLLIDEGVSYSFRGCYTLRECGYFNVTQVKTIANAFTDNPSLEKVYLDGLKVNLNLGASPLFKEECILYMIEKASATGITITLHASAYDRAMANEEIVAAMASKQVNIAKA